MTLEIDMLNEENGRLRRAIAAWKAECKHLKSLTLPAQPAQEPVAWMRPSEEGYDSAFRDHSTVMACTGNPWTGWVPLYTAQPAAQPAQEPVTHTINSTRSAAVATDHYWIPIDENTPRGVKLQLCNKEFGVAVYGICGSKELYFNYWAPLPKFKKD